MKEETGLQTFERDDVLTARKYLRNLSYGRTPLEGTDLPEEAGLDEDVQRSFALAADLLDAYLENGGFNRVTPARKKPFAITQAQREEIPVSKQPVGVMSLSNRITSVLPYDMQRVSYNNISAWLENIGALAIKVLPDGSRKRLATDLGNELGIKTVERQAPGGNVYLKNVYDLHAQQFILDNLEPIMAFSTRKAVEAAAEAVEQPKEEGTPE